MATGGTSKFSSDQLDERKSACCSPCSENGINSRAKHYCVDCELYFCSKCVQCHKLIPSLKSHQLNDVDVSNWTTDDENEESGPACETIMKCTIHKDKPIDTYCKDHDEICCVSCAFVKHRSCPTVSISVAAKDFNSNPEVNEIKERLKNTLQHFKQEKMKRTNNIESIGKQKIELIDIIDKYEETIISKIRKLADISRHEIRSKYEEHKTDLDKDIEALNVVITTTTAYVDKMERTDDELLFCNVATSKMLLKDGEILLQTIERERELKIFLNMSLEKTVDELKSLSSLEDDLATFGYKSTFFRNVDLKDCGSKEMSVFNMIVMDTGDMLLTDHERKTLMRFNSELLYKDEISLTGQPCAVCKLENDEIGVRIWDTREIHTVSLGQTMQLRYSFTVANNGYGMAYDADAGELFACEENQVSVYSKTGNHLRTYDTNEDDEQLFSKCRHIAVSENKDIYVTDRDNGLIVLDKTGNLKMEIVSLDFNDTWPLCLLPGHICFVGSFSTGDICQIDKDGKRLENKIYDTVGRKCTYCVAYDHTNPRLIVAGKSSVISIYTLLPNEKDS